MEKRPIVQNDLGEWYQNIHSLTITKTASATETYRLVIGS